MCLERPYFKRLKSDSPDLKQEATDFLSRIFWIMPVKARLQTAEELSAFVGSNKRSRVMAIIVAVQVGPTGFDRHSCDYSGLTRLKSCMY